MLEGKAAPTPTTPVLILEEDVLSFFTLLDYGEDLRDSACPVPEIGAAPTALEFPM